jgi:(methylthio)acryloyl-CoA hydratase
MALESLRDLLEIETIDDVARICLTRPEKRNALSDALIECLGEAFAKLPDSVRAVVLHGRGDHFSAGLDLAELSERNAAEGMMHSRGWHSVFERIQFGKVPVIAALHGAVVGGGLELACAAHLRVADETTFFALPEGTRGLFVGGGGSVRIPRLIGFSRMTDMMLTGRVFDAHGGERIGLAHYVTKPGEGLAKAMELARKIAGNAPLSNFAVMHALPRIADQPMQEGFLLESMMAAIAQSDEQAKHRMRDFLQNKADKVRKAD